MYRYNIVESIFAEQVGVLILASDIRATTGPADPFTSSNPNTLLSQLSAYRNSTPAARQRGLAAPGGAACNPALCRNTERCGLRH
jgi:hypothetical protein